MAPAGDYDDPRHIISLFNQNVRIYETNNNGRWYDFGFCLGAGIIISNGTHQGIIRIG